LAETASRTNPMKYFSRLIIIVLGVIGFPVIAGASCQVPAFDTGVQLVNDINACLNAVSAGGLPGGATTGQFLGQGSAAPAWFSLSTDLSCSNTSPGNCQIIGLRGITLKNTAPLNNQVPTFISANGDIEWTNQGGGTGGSGVPAGGTEGQFLLQGASGAQWNSLSGDLSGSTTSPGNVTVNTVKGGQTPVTTSGATAGQIPIENSSGSGYNWLSFSGDVANSTGTPGAMTVQGIRNITVKNTAPTNGQVPEYVSTNNDIEWTTLSTTGTGNLPGGATAGQFLLENSGATASSWFTLSGDVSNSTSSPGNLTVNTVKGGQTPVTTASAATGTIPVYDGSATHWYSFGGDVLNSNNIVGNWTASHAYPINQRVLPTTNNAGNYVFIAANPGTSGSTTPTWPQTVNSTVNDNGITWINIGTVLAGAMRTVGLQGLPIKPGTPSNGQVLTYSGSNSDLEWSSPGVVAGGSEGQFYIQGSTAPAWTSISGDITASTTTPGQLTVNTIGGATPVVNNGSAFLTGLTTTAFTIPPAIQNPANSFTASGVDSNYDLYLNSNITITIGPGWNDGQFVTFNIHQPNNGATFTFSLLAGGSASIHWPDNVVPSGSTTNGAVDVYQCEYLKTPNAYYCGLTLPNVH
jgi:hypothetical protein